MDKRCKLRSKRVTFIGILLLCKSITALENPWLLLPNITGELCPYSDVCMWKNKSMTSSVPSETSYCCKDCSCDETCGEHGSCCFPEFDIVDRSQMSCTYTHTPLVKMDTRFLFPSYYMVDKNPPLGCDNKTNVDFTGVCGNINVTGREFGIGSLYPVFSHEKSRIYRNIHCAICHGVTDSIFFTIRQICKTVFETVMGVSYRVGEILPMYTEEDCFIEFTASSNILQEMESERCYRDTINSCAKPTFSIPEGYTSLRPTDVDMACTSGFLSPYLHNVMYANVFCFLCNGNAHYVSGSKICSNSVFQKTSMRGFVSILNFKQIDNMLSSRRLHNIDEDLACIAFTKKNQYECKRIYCPLGQVVVDGSCDFISKQLQQTSYNIWLSLKLDTCTPLMASDLSGLSANKLIGLLSDTIKRAWKTHWFLTKIGIESLDNNNDENTVVKRFVAQLLFEPYSVQPKKLIGEIQEAINVQEMFLAIGNKSMKLFQTFTKFNYISSQTGVFKSSVMEQLSSNGVPDHIFKRTYFKFKDRWRIMKYKPLFITQMFFCNQVELTQKEIVQYGDYSLVYYKKRNIYLNNGQFALIKHPDGNHTVRICLSDSGFTVSTSSSASIIIVKWRLHFIMYLVIFFS